MSKSDIELLVYIFLLVLVVSVSTVFSLFSAQQEANTFNRLCEPKVQVTTWDAMWSELRVDSCVNK